MSGVSIDPRLSVPRTAPKKSLQFSWSDPRFRNIVWQVLILGAVAAIIWYLVGNTRANLAARHIATGFEFLGRDAHIPISESLISYNDVSSTFGRALVVGILNTLKVAVVGVLLATIWGTLLGVARLSHNWLVSRLAGVYVEVVRDIPVLLQLLFWYGLLQTLPPVRQALHVGPFYFSARGINFPTLDWTHDYWWVLGAVLVGALGTLMWSRTAAHRQEETGVRPAVWPVALGMMVLLPLAVWALLGAPWTPDVPVLGRYNLVGGGNLSPEYGALTLGLVIYTAAYIAEIVRSGILAVPTGQWEAAGALGLRPGPVLRRVVLPQAMRVIIPPMTSQYLNLTKNSSLAVAIGFQDVTSIAQTTLNQTGQSIEGIALLMLVYLTISLSISLFMNWYNTRLRLVER